MLKGKIIFEFSGRATLHRDYQEDNNTNASNEEEFNIIEKLNKCEMVLANEIIKELQGLVCKQNVKIVDCNIYFSEGSIEWQGMITVLECGAIISGNIALLQFIGSRIKHVINRVVRRKIPKNYQYVNTTATLVQPQDQFDIVEYTRKEIEGARSVYKWLASILGLIIVTGIWFTYKSAKDFKDEIRADTKLLKQEVETRVGRELGTEAIQLLIKEKVTARVDKVAESIIATQIDKRINPKIAEAEKKLITLGKEIAKIKYRNHMTELADKSISEASRLALDELWRMVDEAKDGSAEKHVAKAEALRVIMFWNNSERMTNVPGSEYFDDSGINYNKLTTKELINLLLTDKRWQVRRKCARLLNNRKEVDVAVALVKTLENDSDLGVVKMALTSFSHVTRMPDLGILEYDETIEWWQKNKIEVIQKLKDK